MSERERSARIPATARLSAPAGSSAALAATLAAALLVTVPGRLSAAAGIRYDVGAEPAEQGPAIVFADGTGLPAGSGIARDGEPLYRSLCADCHGGRGQGGSALELVGDHDSLTSEWPDRGIAAFWPYAPPLFDYLRRAMPPDAPGSLSTEQTWALLAYLLELNGLIDPGTAVDGTVLSALRLPNRDGFTDPDDLSGEIAVPAQSGR